MGILENAASIFAGAIDRLGQEMVYIAQESQDEYVITATFHDLGDDEKGRYGELSIKQSVIANPKNMDMVVIDSVTWRVVRVIEASAGVVSVLIRRDEKVKV